MTTLKELLDYERESELITLKEQLKADLKVNRYNLGHLASRVEISQSHLSNILSGFRTPPKDLAVKLALSASLLTDKLYEPIQFTE